MSFIVVGAASWAGLLYAIKDVDFRFDMHAAARQHDPIHYSGMVFCALFSWVCAILGFCGAVIAFRQGSKPVIAAALYLLFGCVLSLPGAMVTLTYSSGQF